MPPRSLPVTAAAKLRGHTDIMTCLAWVPGEEVLATGSRDGTARLWDLGRPGAPALVLETSAKVYCLAWSGDGRLLATGGGGGRAAVWSRGGGRVAGLVGHTRTICAILFNADGGLVATGSNDGTCRVWEAETGTCRQVVRTEDWVRAVVWRDEKELFIGAGDGTILHCRVGEDQPVETYRGHTGRVLSLAWDPRGGVLASGSMDGTVRTWRPDSASPALATLTGHEDYVWEVVWRPGMLSILASSDRSGEVRTWDTEAGTCLFTLLCAPGGEGGLSSISFSPGGQLLAAGGGEVRVWRVETGELALVCQVKGTRVSWSPGGDRLAVTTEEGGVDVFRHSLSLGSLAAQAVASCLRGREGEGVGRLEIPDSLKGEVRILL